MKQIGNHILVLLLIVIFFSCKNESDITIGFLMPDSEGSRWPIDQSYIEKAAEENGVKVISKYVINDENMQQKQAVELLEMGVDVLIIVSVNANTAAAMVRDAHSYNVPVIAYDRLIKNSDVDYFVSFEGAEIGNLMLEHALRVVPKGNYVLLFGEPADNNAIFIKEAQEATLKPYVERGDINIVYKGFVDNWSPDNAHKKMERILAFSDQKIDAIVTSYDGLALGAIKALKQYPDQNPRVITGQDAQLDAIHSILNDEMSLTIYKSVREIANASVKLAINLAKREKITNATSTINNGRKDVPSILLKPVAVHKNNIRETVIADEYLSEQEVYGISQ